MVGLTDRGDEPVRGFLARHATRVALARALLHDPALLLLDDRRPDWTRAHRLGFAKRSSRRLPRRDLVPPPTTSTRVSTSARAGSRCGVGV